MNQITPYILNPVRTYKSVAADGTLESTSQSAPNASFAKVNRVYSGGDTPGWSALSQRQKSQARTLNYDLTYSTTAAGLYQELHKTRYTSGPNAGKHILNRTRTWDDGRGILSRCNYQIDPDARNRAVARLAAEMQGMKVNFAQAFAERKQTASLITSTAGRLTAAAMALRRGDPRGLSDALGVSYNDVSKRFRRVPKGESASKRLANYWNEYAFGWRPLISDVYGATELLSQHIRDDAAHETVRGSATRRWEDTVITSIPYTRHEISYTSTTKFVCRFRLDSAARQTLSSTGISNPALLAWELLPYSFVADWFIPVGGYLKTLDAFSGFEFLDGHSVGFHRASSTCVRGGKTADVWNGTNGYSYVEVTNYQSSTSLRYTRDRLSAFPSAGPPRFQNPLGGEFLTKAISAIALLAQAFLRK